MTSSPPAVLSVALVGNPNAGKSTLFNALSGLRQHVGNYPGVTVEMKVGTFTVGGRAVEVIDLPGTYSLAARSPDEMVAVDLLLGRRPDRPRPDAVVSVVDASNLDRHLYLTSQLADLGVPVVLAVNMTDVAASHGLAIDYAALAAATGLTVVPIQANKGVGIDKLRGAIVAAADAGDVSAARRRSRAELPAAVDTEAAALAAEVGGLPPFLARRLVLDVGGYVEGWLVGDHGPRLKDHLTAARDRLAAAGHPVSSVEAKARFGWVRGVVAAAVAKPAVRPVTAADRIDRVLTHRVWGTAVFLAVMAAVFQGIFAAAEPFTGRIEAATGWLAGAVNAALPPGPLRSLVADGVVAGVGGVVVFVPQILILFGLIAVLEDCGYLARAAFLMDRVMSRCGLSGKSFIPMLSSVACAVPGVMATRVIENRRDRLATIVVAPLMSCSARLPVYALLIAAFLTDGFAWWVPGLTLFAMYMVGFVAAPLVALALRSTVLRGDRPVFVLELPAYKRPSARTVVRRMADAGWQFLRRAGTLILASMVVVWALLYFPNASPSGERYDLAVAELQQRAEADGLPDAEKDALETEAARLTAAWKANSLLGRTGRALEPAFAPLGWDWKLGMAALASFPAREVIVGTLGIIYQQGEVDAGDDEQRQRLGAVVRAGWAGDPSRGRYAVPVALSVMVFFALCMQCASTLAVIRRETNSWAWPAFTFGYMTALAYAGALATYQVGRLIVDATGG